MLDILINLGQTLPQHAVAWNMFISYLIYLTTDCNLVVPSINDLSSQTNNRLLVSQ